MPARQDADRAGRAGPAGGASAAGSPSRSLPLAVTVALAVVATLVAVLTSDPVLLRGCVVVSAWAVVGAAWAAVRQAGERRAAAERERELRRAYDRELDLEAAAHREHELGLEADLRREADEALRAELAELARLREQLARVSGLGDSLAGLARLREDVAALGALRGDLTALSRLHEDVGRLGDLRGELSALRAQLAETIDAEMLVERILLRTRGSRAASAEPGTAVVDAGPAAVGRDEPAPRELTGGRPAVHLDPPPATREYQVLARERSWDPGTVERSTVAPEPDPAVRARPDAARRWDPLSDPLPAELLAETEARLGAPRHDSPRHDRPRHDRPRHDRPRHEGPRHGSPADEADRHDPLAWRDERPGSAATPLEWLADHSLLDPLDQPWTTPTRAVPVTAAEPPTGPVRAQRPRPVPHRRRHGDEDTPPQPDTAGQARLGDVLGGATPPATGRRRHRYREDDAADDVLSRVLRGE